MSPDRKHSIEVAIEYDDPRYWYMMLGAIALGYLLNKAFDLAPKEKKVNFLMGLGVFMVAIQLYMPIRQSLDPNYLFTYQHNLPLHFCSVNFWLMAFNCFIRSRMLFVLTAYMGITGGFHTFMTPLLTAGDSPIQVVHFVIVHSGLIFVPIVMLRHFNMKFRKFDWVRAYFFDVGISTAMIGVNYYLNHYVHNPDPEVYFANYMYVTVAPDVNNPFLPKSLTWPFYLLPLHFLFILHMILINQIIRWRKGVKLNAWRELLH